MDFIVTCNSDNCYKSQQFFLSSNRINDSCISIIFIYRIASYCRQLYADIKMKNYKNKTRVVSVRGQRPAKENLY